MYEYILEWLGVSVEMKRECQVIFWGKALQEEGAKYKAPEFGMNVLCLRKGKVE